MNRRGFIETMTGVAVATAVVGTAAPPAAAEELGFGRDFDTRHMLYKTHEHFVICRRPAGHSGPCMGLPRTVASGDGWSQLCYEHFGH